MAQVIKNIVDYAKVGVPIPESQQRIFDQEGAVLRHPRESKGQDYRETRDNKTGNLEGCR